MKISTCTILPIEKVGRNDRFPEILSELNIAERMIR